MGTPAWIRSLRRKWPLWLRLGLATAMFAGLVAASLVPDLAPSPEYGIDLLVHASVYLVVTVFTVVLVAPPLMSATAILTLSGTIEVLQSLVPGRTGAWIDVAANGFGIAMALAVVGAMGALGLRFAGAKMVCEGANARRVE